MAENIWESSDCRSDTSVETTYESENENYGDSSMKESFCQTVSDVECSHFHRISNRKKVYRKKKKKVKEHLRPTVTISTKGNLSPMLTSNTMSGLIEKSQDTTDQSVEVDVVIDQDKRLVKKEVQVKDERKSVPSFGGLKSPNESSSSSQNSIG